MSADHTNQVRLYQMSDDERALSEDDDADLFESESEDQGSEIERSIDLPALSPESLYVRSPPVKEDHDGDEEASFQNTGCESDQSGADGFDVSDGVNIQATGTPHQQIRDESDFEHRENGPVEDERADPGQSEQEANRSIWRGVEAHTEKDAGSEEDVAMNEPSFTIQQSESPRIPEPIDHQQDVAQLAYENRFELDKQDDELSIVRDAQQETCIQSSDFQCDEQSSRFVSSTDNLNESSDPSLIPTSTCADKTQSDTKLDELDLLSTESEIRGKEANQGGIKQKETVRKENSTSRTSPREIQEQQTEAIKSPPFDSLGNTAKTPVYTVESLFPVIYESGPSALASKISKAAPTTYSIPIASTNAHRPSREWRRQTDGGNADKSIASRLAVLQSQRDAARNELANATRTFKLQLSMVETDNRKLSQRNTRLKKQLSMMTVDLQRSNAEMGKLKTEIELYAAKLPRLQAELLEETAQVDETQAQSVQNQLVLTQLKARSHVLQTRNLGLEAQNNKLTQQLRECQQQLKRKVTALQQQIEKASKMEADLNQLKSTYAQEKLDWKTRMTSALQRFEHDKAKLEAQKRNEERTELREVKDRAEKAVKKRRTAETTAAKLEEQLKHCKHEISSANDAVQRHLNEVRTLEALLRKAHRDEATLCNDLAVCQTKLHTLQGEKKRRVARPATALTRRQRLEQQIPIELLLPLTDSSDDEDNQDKQCCSHCLASTRTNEPQYPLSIPPSVCSECPQLQDHLQQLQRELRRVRSLHTVELHAQASILDALLQHNKKGNYR